MANPHFTSSAIKAKDIDDDENNNNFDIDSLPGDDSTTIFGGNVASMKENSESTGRWTREEHLTFIKGLEMYGKGWKKIASLIKTRTVVQIRTHAQKYFLKLSKARQNGDSSSSIQLDNKGGVGPVRKKLKRKYPDRPIAIAPPLQPFLRTNPNDANQGDISDGLYNFLSPKLTIPESQSLEELYSAQDNRDLKPLPIQKSYSITSCPSIDQKNITVPPLWYRKGHQVDKLLQDAEGLNWVENGEGLIHRVQTDRRYLQTFLNNLVHLVELLDSGQADSITYKLNNTKPPLTRNPTSYGSLPSVMNYDFFGPDQDFDDEFTDDDPIIFDAMQQLIEYNMGKDMDLVYPDAHLLDAQSIFSRNETVIPSKEVNSNKPNHKNNSVQSYHSTAVPSSSLNHVDYQKCFDPTYYHVIESHADMKAHIKKEKESNLSNPGPVPIGNYNDISVIEDDADGRMSIDLENDQNYLHPIDDDFFKTSEEDLHNLMKEPIGMILESESFQNNPGLVENNIGLKLETNISNIDVTWKDKNNSTPLTFGAISDRAQTPDSSRYAMDRFENFTISSPSNSRKHIQNQSEIADVAIAKTKIKLEGSS